MYYRPKIAFLFRLKRGLFDYEKSENANRYNYNGMQAVGLATGYFDNHTINEHVFLDSFLRTGEMVMRIVLEYGEQQEKYKV